LGVDEEMNMLKSLSWRQISPYPEAAPAFTDGGGGAFTQVSGGKRNCFGRIVCDRFPIEADRAYFVTVAAYPENVRDSAVNLHALINWYDKNNWNDPSFWPPVTKRDYIKGVREGDRIIFSGTFTAPSALELAGNPPADAVYAEVELGFKWSETGRVTWRDASVSAAETVSRPVRAAALLAIPKKTVRESLDNALRMIDKIAEQNPDIICLNETALTEGMDFIGSAVTLNGYEVCAFCEKAAEHGIYIIAGLVTKEDGILFNSALLIGPGGKTEGIYRKIQIPLDEGEKGLTPGDEIGVFDIRVRGQDVRIGIMICFDAEFPEIGAVMYEKGVEMIFVPTNGSTELGRRAKDAGAYIVLSASPAGTRIFTPAGTLAAQGEGFCLYEADLNGQLTEEWTGPGPAHADVRSALRQERRTDVYSKKEGYNT
jgi:predicted amidohydrolase